MSNSWYMRYYGDYARDTGHLTLAEHGAYTKLLDHYYATGAPLPVEYPALYRVCVAMTQEEQAAVKRVVDQFFKVNGDGMRHNKRADSEIEKRGEKSCKAAHSAYVRWQKEREAEAMRTQCERICDGNAIQSPDIQNHIPEPKPDPEPNGEISVPPKRKRTQLLADDTEWLAKIKAEYSKIGVNVDRETVKAKAWLTGPKGKGRKFTRQYFLNWLSKCDRNIGDQDSKSGKGKSWVDFGTGGL